MLLERLSVIDYGYATDDFDIILDALVPQKSKFTVNKQSLNAKVGDLLLVKENGYPYVGIITSIKSDDKNQTKVETKDYLSLLDVDVPLPTSFSGNAAQFSLNRSVLMFTLKLKIYTPTAVRVSLFLHF